jgi:large subunit ribosomal protein L24
MPAHVRKGDQVIVNSGDDKGRVSEVLRVMPKRGLVLVKGVNMITRHLRPSRNAPQGGIISREAPIHLSKVNPVVDGKPSRVRFNTGKDGAKTRVAAKGGKVLSAVTGPSSKK